MKAVTRSTIVLLAVVFTTRLAAAEENRPEADPSLAIELSNVAANATLPSSTLPSSTLPEEPPRGSLVIIGGALRYSPNDVWDRIIELAGGKGAKIAVFPTASSDPLANGSLTVEALKQAGAEPFLVPVRVTSGELDYRQAVADTKLVEQVRAAGGVYFIGGSQERITQALGSTAGDSTPMLSAIWEVYRRGGVIAGTSAGAAVMSHQMYRYSRGVLTTLEDGVQMGKELAPGLGFLHPEWFVEQHCLVRGRFGRALVAMHTLNLKYGVGVDENTAVVVRNGREMDVIGARGAIVMDLSQATSDRDQRGFNLKNARLSYLDFGDAFDLAELRLTPAAQKQATRNLDPTGAAPQPMIGGEKLVETNILGNNTLVELMARLIESRQTEAIGLAFDAGTALKQTTSGFEFRFYREADSRGWYPAGTHGGTYTVQNIHLDIRRIEIAGPLYK